MLTLRDYREFEQKYNISIFFINNKLAEGKIEDLKAEWIAYLTYLSWRKQEENREKTFDDFLNEVKSLSELVKKFQESWTKK